MSQLRLRAVSVTTLRAWRTWEISGYGWKVEVGSVCQGMILRPPSGVGADVGWAFSSLL